ncbi:Phytochelatin synthase-domain-containing protein [Geranomyces variabilis]|nr:Phytochelatin synthase-domain-containing protein [Geranomyces variabilis]
MPENTFYKRALPSTCINFNSPRGRELFTGSLNEGHLESYFSLSLQFLTQAEPAFCGLSTLCMVLNALEIDPGRQWRGSCWRWYNEEMLDCCRTREEVLQSGITLSEFVCLARCNGLKATMSRADRATQESFLRVIERTSREPNEFLVVSYDRGTLNQTGSGHFSPVGGYNAAEKMSLAPLDPATGKPRGYVVLQKGHRGHMQSALSQLAVNRESWPRLCDILFKQLPKQFVKSPPASPAEFIKTVIEHIPDAYDSVVENRLPLFVGPAEPVPGVVDPVTTTSSAATSAATSEAFNSYLQGLDDLLHKLAATALYRLVDASLTAKKAEAKRRETIPMATEASDKSSVGLSETNDTAPTYLPQLRSTFADSSIGAISSPPMSPRYQLNFQARRSSSNLNPTAPALAPPASLIDIHPINHPLNDFTAFLTIFLFALFSYKPMHEELVDIVEEEPGNTGISAKTTSQTVAIAAATAPTAPTAAARRPEKRRLSMAEQVHSVLNLDIQDTVIREEVAFLRNQIAALTELSMYEGQNKG